MVRFILCLIVCCICVLTATNAAAQSDLGFKGIGLEVGFVSPENIDATVGLGAFADFGTIVPNLMLEGYVDYWSKSEEEFGLKASVRDIAVGAKAKYHFDVSNSRIRPFVGGGIGLHFLRAEIAISDQIFGGFDIPGMSVGDSSTKLGLDLGGGIKSPISPKMDFLTEIWFGLVSDVNQLSFKIGMVYNLGS